MDRLVVIIIDLNPPALPMLGALISPCSSLYLSCPWSPAHYKSSCLELKPPACPPWGPA
jgi:hypothetical protein